MFGKGKGPFQRKKKQTGKRLYEHFVRHIRNGPIRFLIKLTIIQMVTIAASSCFSH